MLLNLREYHRPTDEDGAEDLAHVLELLARTEVHTVPLAGGDTLLASSDSAIEAVVDLQGLNLDWWDTDLNAGALQAGAMATRADLAALATPGSARDCPLGIIADGARRWSGSAQRNRATLGGALATAASNDPLVVALLVCDTCLMVYTRTDCRWLSLAEFLLRRKPLLAEPALIAEINVPLPPEATMGYALADVARTPADTPIVVAAAAIAQQDGRCTAARLALGGIGAAPVRLPEVEALLEGQVLTSGLFIEAGRRAIELIQPAGDFRGSVEYRKAMAGALSARALREAWRQIAHAEK